MKILSNCGTKHIITKLNAKLLSSDIICDKGLFNELKQLNLLHFVPKCTITFFAVFLKLINSGTLKLHLYSVATRYLRSDKRFLTPVILIKYVLSFVGFLQGYFNSSFKVWTVWVILSKYSTKLYLGTRVTFFLETQNEFI